jgi:hypothetical protein
VKTLINLLPSRNWTDENGTVASTIIPSQAIGKRIENVFKSNHYINAIIITYDDGTYSAIQADAYDSAECHDGDYPSIEDATLMSVKDGVCFYESQLREYDTFRPGMLTDDMKFQLDCGIFTIDEAAAAFVEQKAALLKRDAEKAEANKKAELKLLKELQRKYAAVCAACVCDPCECNINPATGTTTFQ